MYVSWFLNHFETANKSGGTWHRSSQQEYYIDDSLLLQNDEGGADASLFYDVR